MIKYESNNGNAKLEARGAGIEITADALLLIRLLYDKLREGAGEGCANIFKEAIMDNMHTCFESIEKLEDDEEEEDNLMNRLNELEDALTELQKLLSGNNENDKHIKS